MTLAVCKAMCEYGGDESKLSEIVDKQVHEIGVNYPDCGYGERFGMWIFLDDSCPYNSYGNGAAMRVSPVAYAAKTIEEVKQLSALVTGVSHNHPEGLKGAEATAVCTWLALHGSKIPEIKNFVQEHYYPVDFTLDEIRDSYGFDEICQGTVPQALEAFFESTSFEDAIRNAISLGGDSDALAAITGAVAVAYYGVPGEIAEKAKTYLDGRLHSVFGEFVSKF